MCLSKKPIDRSSPEPVIIATRTRNPPEVMEVRAAPRRRVAALLARHDELRSAPRDQVRGMPLGLPPLSAEDIRLVESWVAPGKPL